MSCQVGLLGRKERYRGFARKESENVYVYRQICCIYKHKKDGEEDEDRCIGVGIDSIGIKGEIVHI